MKTKSTFNSSGIVYGNLWGGGQGAYPARKLYADTKEDILKQANDGLDGSLDSGMGYESLIGAYLIIEEIITALVDGEHFTRSENEVYIIGDLTEDQQEFCRESMYYN